MVFTGRPNAGKSSIIREVMSLNVKVGKTSGTTRWISEYPLSKGLILVDMPGYGRAAGITNRVQDKNNRRIIYFLETNAPTIVLAVHVLDISTFSEVTRRLGNKNFISVDVEIFQLLSKAIGEFPLVAANKIDKANNEEIATNLKELIQQAASSEYSSIEHCIFPVSAKTGEWLGLLKSAINDRLVAKGYKTPFKPR